ncbi:MAG: potassium transporter Kup [Proteobacteria bacterium]|nr:potassium transporter Kup [Pseudomonadota bacterium]
MRQPTTDSTVPHESAVALRLTALGIVYGDIGTSPLYALRECFSPLHGVAVTRESVLGVLSLVAWALILVVSVKYVGYLMRADNRGEGGVLALMGLASVAAPRKAATATLIGLLGAGLLLGDGMITPAISVLSAVEGLEIATPALGHLVVPLTIALLIGLFALQRRGTSGVGAVFGPVILLWFVVIGGLGLRALWADPGVLWALSPSFAVVFLAHQPGHALTVLGSVFLAVTGAEALYADMGHVGRRPIRQTWYGIVLPALLLNYLGQGAALLADPRHATSPFFMLAPDWALVPLVLLATAATIIASQALISGAFSLARQAVMLGFWPRMAIRHTSAAHVGQIYIPTVNALLMLSAIALVLGFGSSSALAAAYGVAVVAAMITTTLLAYVVARFVWKWSAVAAISVTVVLLALDGSFLFANLVKVAQGGWFPLVIAGTFFVLMTTWRRGRQLMQQHIAAESLDLDDFYELMRVERAARVPGTAVFMTGTGTGTPAALLHNFTHNRVVHEHVVLLQVVTADEPRVPPTQRLKIEPLKEGFVRAVALYGFMEEPDIARLLAHADLPGYAPNYTAFFFGRETILRGARGGMAAWRKHLFGQLSGLAQPAVAFFRIPPEHVIEVGRHIRL